MSAFSIPNLITLLRIVLIPIFVIVFYLPSPIAYYGAAIIFALASISDWLDGYLARTLKQTSKIGAFLDPVADKLIVAVALILLVSSLQLSYLAIPASIIVGREIVVSALREWMAELGKRTSVAVSYIGKIKTAMQMISVFLLLLYHPFGPIWVAVVGYFLLWIAAILTLWSMFLYLKIAWPELKVYF